LVQIARAKFDLHKNDSLDAIVKKVSNIEPSADNTNLLTARNILLSKIALSQGNLSKNMEYLKEIKDFCSKYNNQFFLVASLSRLGEIHFRSKQQDTAIYYANQTIQISQKYNYNRHLLSASELLIEIYNQQNQKDSVLKYLQLKIKANEVLYGKKQLSHLLLIANREKIQKKDIELLEQKNKATTNLLLFGSIGILLILGMMFLSYRNRQKSKINEFLSRQKQNIESKNQELEQTLSLLKATQAQLIQSEKLASLGELTAGIAHEIQNPLNFVNNFAEVSAEMLDEMQEELKKEDTTEAIAIAADLKTNLEKINHHGQRASSIVKGMLEHSRQGRDAMHRVFTDINALADEYLRLAYHGWRAKDSRDAMHGVFTTPKIETHFDPDLPLVSVIPQDIGRVLLNLINNAFYAVAERSRSTVHQRAVETLYATSLQYPPYEPIVTVSTEKTGDQIIIKIQDNGNGIPESIRDKIFQPFFTTKPTGQGTGLGLSLAYDIVVKGHGGTLEVESTEGLGTKFIIRLV
jgi:signal transduction histidine kinase